MDYRRLLPVVTLTFIVVSATATAQGGDGADGPGEHEVNAGAEELKALEIASHQQWLEGDLPALNRLMTDDFRFIAMNGAVESKTDVVGGGDGPRAPRPLQISELRVEPDEVVLRGDQAIVLSTLYIQATVQGRPIPERHRIMSVFLRDGQDWLLFARSITPVLAPPR